MRYTLRCCHCEQTFPFDFSKATILPDTCPYCHNNFLPHEINKFNSLLDSLDVYNQQFVSLNVKRAFEPTSEELHDTEMADDIFSSDMRHITFLYRNSKGKQQQLIADIIDKLYLLLNRDSRSSSDTFSSSQKVYDLLNGEFESSIAEKNRETAELLDTDL